MASLMSMLGRTFGTVASTADMISTGVTVLNERMTSYAQSQKAICLNNQVQSLAESKAEFESRMLELTKEMDQIHSDSKYAQAIAWAEQLRKELNGEGIAEFPSSQQKSENQASDQKGVTFVPPEN